MQTSTHTRTEARHKAQRGAAAVEAGFLLPLVLLSLLVLFDFGRYLWVNNVVHEAASQGLRMAVLNEPDNAEVADAALREILRGGLYLEPSVDVGPREPGQFTNVSVSVDFSFLFLPTISNPGSWTVTASAEGLCER